MYLEYESRKLSDLVLMGFTYFWLFEFNTSDWILAKISKDKKIVTRLDTNYEYSFDDIQECPAQPVEKPLIIKQQMSKNVNTL
jgi:hypothetical protein